MDVLQSLRNTKIKHVQLDLFGFCNAACWYCPVKYIPQPKRTMAHMPVAMLEKILVDIDQERRKDAGLVCNTVQNIYTAHYGEVLLYKYFDDFLRLLDQYNFTTSVLSNGLNLTSSKIDAIKNNQQVVSQIILNIPSFDPVLWADRSGLNIKQYDRLMKNLEYADSQLAGIKDLVIVINGVDNDNAQDGVLFGEDLGSLMMDTDPATGEKAKAYEFAKQKFKNFHIHKEYVLHDRAGLLSNFISNQEYVEEKLHTGTVVGCKGREIEADRTTEWLHVNSIGEAFLCCQDYNMDYVFGNLFDSSLSDIWRSEQHVETIMTARKEICRKCYQAEVE